MESKVIKLKDISLLITDGKHGDCRNEKDSGYYFLSAKDIKNGILLYDNARQIKKDDFIEVNKRTQLEPYDILLSNSGTIGRLAIAQNNRLTLRTTFQKSVAIIKPNIEYVYTYWLYYYLSSNINELIKFAGGTAQKNLLLKDLRDFKVKIPSFINQRKIANILKNYDSLIENNNRRIEILVEMAQAIHKEWFVHFRFPGHEEVKMVDSKLGKIPEGWQIRKIGEIMNIFSGYAFKSKNFSEKGKYKITTIKNAQQGQFIPDGQNKIIKIPDNMPEHCYLNDGDILLSLTGNIGRTCIVYGCNHLLNQRVAKLVPKEEISWSFTYFMFLNDYFRRKLENISSGVAQQNLSPIKMGNIKIIYPNDKVLDKYNNITERILNIIVLLFKKNKILRQSRDILLTKLISGEINVEN